jgi:hypothetical protein
MLMEVKPRVEMRVLTICSSSHISAQSQYCLPGWSTRTALQWHGLLTKMDEYQFPRNDHFTFIVLLASLVMNLLVLRQSWTLKARLFQLEAVVYRGETTNSKTPQQESPPKSKTSASLSNGVFQVFESHLQSLGLPHCSLRFALAASVRFLDELAFPAPSLFRDAVHFAVGSSRFQSRRLPVGFQDLKQTRSIVEGLQASNPDRYRFVWEESHHALFPTPY